MAEHTTLSKISSGQTVLISNIGMEELVESRMAELGIFTGSKLHVLSNRDDPSPLIVVHHNTQVILAKKLSEKITVYVE